MKRGTGVWQARVEGGHRALSLLRRGRAGGQGRGPGTLRTSWAKAKKEGKMGGQGKEDGGPGPPDLAADAPSL